MSERRPAQTIGELDIHLGFLLQELKDMREKVDGMMAMLATKEELAREVSALRAEITNGSARSVWKVGTEIAIGIVAICTAAGFAVALFRFLKL